MKHGKKTKQKQDKTNKLKTCQQYSLVQSNVIIVACCCCCFQTREKANPILSYMYTFGKLDGSYCFFPLFQSARYSKLEKADILEMTVKHLREMQRGQMAGKRSCTTVYNTTRLERSSAAARSKDFTTCSLDSITNNVLSQPPSPPPRCLDWFGLLEHTVWD